MAEGHYEVGFNWQRVFLTDAITGFEENTRASLDVSVLAAYDVDFGGFCAAGNRSLQLELEVAIETADGALRGVFSHSVATDPSSGMTVGEPLRTYWPQEVELTPLDGLSGSLDYGVDLELMARTDLAVQLSLDGTSAYGSLMPFLSPRSSVTGAGYTPIFGVFAEDGCIYAAGQSLAMDAILTLPGFVEETPRALFERATSHWRAGPLAARWTDGTTTELNVSAGEPIRVCTAGVHVAFAAVVIDAPVRVESADGTIALDQTLPFVFYPGQAMATANTNQVRRLWIPVEQFERMTGIQGVNFGGAEFGGVYLSNQFDLGANTAIGGLMIEKWQNVEASAADYPSLSW
jgi:hypothetical protein